ncbi:hypothetical protein SAMN04488128_108157 [Chitinophaga eiseniae]|uniref:Uncharacterized protein n=1 Tax=Chitinophaga eiseniae TaxID=634771 RepID=A0A1T4U3Q0_9BACT|nr:hypothetical protein SAMN04488128_108157 [Chitinophaga eiseniae]
MNGHKCNQLRMTNDELESSFLDNSLVSAFRRVISEHLLEKCF